MNLGLPWAEASVEKSLKGPKKWSDKKIITPHNRIFKKEVKSSYTNTIFHSAYTNSNPVARMFHISLCFVIVSASINVNFFW